MNICRILANMKKNDFSCKNYILQEILRQKDSVVFLTIFYQTDEKWVFV